MQAPLIRAGAAGEARRGASALARGFEALTYPKCLVIVLASAVLSLLLAVLLWYVLRWAIFDWKFFAWGWANWVIRQFGGVALTYLLWLMFPALLAIVISCFFDAIIDEVERRNYPDLPPRRRQSTGEIVLYILKFTALILGINLIALPFYLLLPGINLLIAWLANGYVFGREYYEAVAMRRLAPSDMHALRYQVGGGSYRAGIIVAMLKSVPLLNFAIPVVACAYFTHLFHALPWQARAEKAAAAR
jgi:uncharacterized protein involved in cysteine biosynthesis